MVFSGKATGKDALSVLAALGYPCPSVNSCCFCMSLKAGSYVIAILGILPSIVCTILATRTGMQFLEQNGLPKWYAPGMEYIYGTLGVIVFVAHIILVAAVTLPLVKLLIVYLWTLIFYMILSFGMAVLIGAEAIKSGHIDFGASFVLLAAVYTLTLFYFWIVINSLLHVEKEESNVINIHITIL